MLVLKRRKGEEIVINEHTRIRVVGTSDGGCSLAFDAPDSVRIRRAELPAFEEDLIQETACVLRVRE